MLYYDKLIKCYEFYLSKVLKALKLIKSYHNIVINNCILENVLTNQSGRVILLQNSANTFSEEIKI